MESLDKFLFGLSSYLDLSNEKPSQIISLIEETIKISSNSFLALILSFYLKKNYNVILLSEKESLNHYASILRKFVKYYHI